MKLLGSIADQKLARLVEKIFAVPAKAGVIATDASAHLLPLLDGVKLKELGGVLSFESLRDLLKLCCADTLAHAASLTDTDIDATSREAHAIVSAAGNLGLERLSAQARLLEHACRKGEREFIAPLIGDVKNTATATEAEIKDWLAAAALEQKAIA